MKIKIEVLDYEITDSPGEWLPRSITVKNVKVKVDFGEGTIIEVDELRGDYSPEFTLSPFLFKAESVVKLIDAADYRGVDLLEAGEFWHKVDDAVAKTLEQTKVKIA